MDRYCKRFCHISKALFSLNLVRISSGSGQIPGRGAVVRDEGFFLSFLMDFCRKIQDVHR